MIGRSHMNSYQGGGASQGKIIPIKHHFASLIFGVLATFHDATKIILIPMTHYVRKSMFVIFNP